MSDRRFDLVLFGVTGFTGRLVAAYLLQHAPTLRWAWAGRSQERLEAVRHELAEKFPQANDLPLLIADALDPVAMRALVAQSRVVCTTVGPYARYGLPLVEACAQTGTHYCDLTGESPFIRKSIDQYHDIAKASGARIVHCCGFDSIPSDLGTFFLQQALIEKTGAPAPAITALFGESKGGFSGGTVASMFTLFEEASKDRAVRRVLATPHALDPEGGPRSKAKDQWGPGWDPILKVPTGPFIMATINTRVVRRSHALLGYPWGTDFLYNERQSFPASAAGWGMSVALTAGLAGFAAAMSIPAFRGQLQKRLPQPGEGPSPETQAKGYYTLRLYGTAKGTQLIARVSDRLDPGYSGTAKMLGEAACCLALDSLTSPGGVLTPASAMGMTLIQRLQAAGMVFQCA